MGLIASGLGNTGSVCTVRGNGIADVSLGLMPGCRQSLGAPVKGLLRPLHRNPRNEPRSLSPVIDAPTPTGYYANHVGGTATVPRCPAYLPLVIVTRSPRRPRRTWSRDRFLLNFRNATITGFNPRCSGCHGDSWGRRLRDRGNRHSRSSSVPATNRTRADLFPTTHSDFYFSPHCDIHPSRRSIYPVG